MVYHEWCKGVVGWLAIAGPDDVIQTFASVYTDGGPMATVTTKRSRAVAGGRGPSRGAGWVRKNMVMNQRKLDAARRVLGVETDTEAIDPIERFDPNPRTGTVLA